MLSLLLTYCCFSRVYVLGVGVGAKCRQTACQRDASRVASAEELGGAVRCLHQFNYAKNIAVFMRLLCKQCVAFLGFLV